MKRVYRSCYSCYHSEIKDNNGRRVIICHKSLRLYEPKAGQCYPEWCELKKKKGEVNKHGYSFEKS